MKAMITEWAQVERLTICSLMKNQHDLVNRRKQCPKHWISIRNQYSSKRSIRECFGLNSFRFELVNTPGIPLRVYQKRRHKTVSCASVHRASVVFSIWLRCDVCSSINVTQSLRIALAPISTELWMCGWRRYSSFFCHVRLRVKWSFGANRTEKIKRNGLYVTHSTDSVRYLFFSFIFPYVQAIWHLGIFTCALCAACSAVFVRRSNK